MTFVTSKLLQKITEPLTIGNVTLIHDDLKVKNICETQDDARYLTDFLIQEALLEFESGRQSDAIIA